MSRADVRPSIWWPSSASAASLAARTRRSRTSSIGSSMARIRAIRPARGASPSVPTSGMISAAPRAGSTSRATQATPASSASPAARAGAPSSKAARRPAPTTAAAAAHLIAPRASMVTAFSFVGGRARMESKSSSSWVAASTFSLANAHRPTSETGRRIDCCGSPAPSSKRPQPSAISLRRTSGGSSTTTSFHSCTSLALLDQQVRSPARLGGNIARNGEDFPVLFHGQFGGNG